MRRLKSLQTCVTLLGRGLRLAAVLVAGSLMLAGRAAAQPSRPTSNAVPAGAAYRISGKVVDAHSGAALAHCSVRIADVKDRGAMQGTTSGDDGSFAFSELPRGKYSLTAARHGYLEQSYEEHDQFSTAIAVGPGLNSENLIFKLTAEAIIAGTVTDEAGEGVRGAQVRLFQDQDANGVRTTQQQHTVTTDDRGMYELTGVRPGAYFLVVTARPWYAQRLQQAQNGEGSEAQALDVGYPTTFYPGATDEDGATPIPVKGGDRLEADVSLTPQPALRLHLNLPAPKPGERNPSVSISQSLFGQTEGMPVQMTYRGDGTIEIDGILPGHYDVTVGGSGFGPDMQAGSGAKHFQADVASGSTELSEDSGVGETIVTGKVISSAGKLPPNAGISLRASNSRRGQYGALNDAGEFSVGVMPGTYEVLGNIEGMHIASLKISGAALAGRMLTVKTGDVPKLEILAGTGHGEIEGTVLRNGKPASAVMVLLAPEDAKNNQILFRRDQSDSDGTFDLPNVFPGKYRLLAIDNGWDLEWANPAVLEVFLPKSVVVDVKAGDDLKKSVDVQER